MNLGFKFLENHNGKTNEILEEISAEQQDLPEPQGSSLQNLEKQKKNWKQRKTDRIELPGKNNHQTGRRVGEHKRNTLSSYKQSNASMAHQL